MPPKARKKPVKRVFQPLPKNTFWIENDAYDRRVWGHLRAEAPSLRELEDKGSTLLPHFGSLLQDIFCSAIQVQHQLITPTREVLPSALLNRNFLHAIHNGAQYDFLREQTLLNEAHAGLSTLILGERLLALVREEKFLTRRDMRDLWDIQKQEEIVGQKIEEYDNADTIPEDQMSEEGKKALQKAKEQMGGEVQGAEALLRHKTQQLKEDLKQIEAPSDQSHASRSDQSRPGVGRRHRGSRNLGQHHRHGRKVAAGTESSSSAGASPAMRNSRNSRAWSGA